MKKLSLKKLKLEANDMLQCEQLKSVFGGYGYDGGAGNCVVVCANGVSISALPNCHRANKVGACENQGGYSGGDCTC